MEDEIQQAMEYENNLDDALLLTTGLLRLTGLALIPEGLRARVAESVALLRDGKKIAGVGSRALQEGFSMVLDSFQEDMRTRSEARAKQAGVKVATPFRLTKMERETMSAFLLWLVTKRIVEIREGRMYAAYERAFQGMRDGESS